MGCERRRKGRVLRDVGIIQRGDLADSEVLELLLALNLEHAGDGSDCEELYISGSVSWDVTER